MFETSLFLAKVFGLYFVVISLFMLLRKEIFIARITDLLESSASRMVMAFMTLVIGILLIVSHNVAACLVGIYQRCITTLLSRR